MERLIAIMIIFIGSTMTAHSAQIPVFSISIGTEFYSVTIIPNKSFIEIWDQDDDMVYGEMDASIVNHIPTFLGETAKAEQASLAVMIVLGTLNSWDAAGLYDGVLIPTQRRTPPIVGADQRAYSTTDVSTLLAVDSPTDLDYLTTENPSVGYAYASFEPLDFSPVPVPAAAWLFGTALAGLGFVTRKRKALKALKAA